MTVPVRRLHIRLLRAGGLATRVLRSGVFRISVLLGCVALVCPAALPGKRQLPSPPLPIDPTPLPALLNDRDKAMLQQARGPRKLVEAYLDISDAHLDAAEKATDSSDFPTAERELDIYNKSLEQASTTAFSQDSGRRD